jgi:hypothetical protein
MYRFFKEAQPVVFLFAETSAHAVEGATPAEPFVPGSLDISPSLREEFSNGEGRAALSADGLE